MKQYLFRAEAVNLWPTVYDTSDISTIRGGGFYLLDRVRSLAQESVFKENVITEGASAAVFQVETDSPAEIRRKMLTYLYDGENAIREMMFLVEYIENHGKFPETMAGLQGKIRAAQMQTSSIRVFPETFKPASGTDPETGKQWAYDTLNRTLPAHKQDQLKGPVSGFTHRRREQGKTLRKKIYALLLKDQDVSVQDYGFTDELEVLCNDAKQGNLNGKIAFIYIDGNKFGKLQRNFSPEELKAYDALLDNFKKRLLASIIRLAREDKSFMNGNKIRLETLLWGGDEIKLIVPAWMGWKAALCFYDVADEMNMKMEDKELTYAMGLVFAHHKNPIRNVSGVAEELAQTVKDGLSSAQVYQRSHGNRIHYAVLESLETLPKGYGQFATDFYRTASQELSLSPDEMRGLRDFAKSLDAGFSRSKIYSVAQAWVSDSDKKDKKDKGYAEALQRGLDVCEVSAKKKEKLVHEIEMITGTAFGEDKKVIEAKPEKGYRWLQIAELWDYLPSS